MLARASVGRSGTGGRPSVPIPAPIDPTSRKGARTRPLSEQRGLIGRARPASSRRRRNRRFRVLSWCFTFGGFARFGGVSFAGRLTRLARPRTRTGGFAGPSTGAGAGEDSGAGASTEAAGRTGDSIIGPTGGSTGGSTAGGSTAGTIGRRTAAARRGHGSPTGDPRRRRAGRRRAPAGSPTATLRRDGPLAPDDLAHGASTSAIARLDRFRPSVGEAVPARGRGRRRKRPVEPFDARRPPPRRPPPRRPPPRRPPPRRPPLRTDCRRGCRGPPRPGALTTSGTSGAGPTRSSSRTSSGAPPVGSPLPPTASRQEIGAPAAPIGGRVCRP